MKNQVAVKLILFACAAAVVLSGCGVETGKQHVVVATWNVRGYPEKEQASRDWFHRQLVDMKADVVCIQEIANSAKVEQFLAAEEEFQKAAFVDSNDGQDNAIFCTSAVEMQDLPDPCGFQHPPQAVYVACRGFDAVIVTVHLSWTNVSMREEEKVLLHGVVDEMLQRDPDVIIVGDFNTEGADIQELAQSIGMIVMVPSGQDGVGTTWAGHRYDHILISPDLANEEAISCRIVTFPEGDLEVAKDVSDHRPVVAEFRTDLKFKDRQN